MPYDRRVDGNGEPLREPLMADCQTAAVTNLLRQVPGVTAVGNRATEARATAARSPSASGWGLCPGLRCRSGAPTSSATPA